MLCYVNNPLLIAIASQTELDRAIDSGDTRTRQIIITTIIIYTVPDAVAASHVEATSRMAGAASDKAASNKKTKYSALQQTHLLFQYRRTLTVLTL